MFRPCFLVKSVTTLYITTGSALELLVSYISRSDPISPRVPAEVPGIEGKVTVMMPSYRFAHGGQEMKSPPPQCGQHTAEVLREIGYDDAGMDKLRAAKVI